MAYCWLNNHGHKQIVNQTGCSSNTVTNFTYYFRELVSSTLEIEDTLIGGNEIIVEVDETKLGRRKYNKGHKVDGAWVLVGVERTERRKVFMV